MEPNHEELGLDMQPSPEEFEFELEDKRRISFPVKVVAVFAVFLFFISPVLISLSNYLNIEDTKEFNRIMNDPRDNNIYDIEDTSTNRKLANRANYVQAMPNLIYYIGEENGVIIYQNSSQTDDYLIIEIDYIINANNNKLDIKSCYNPKANANENLNSCLKDDEVYVISRKDRAIINIQIFYKYFYENTVI